MLGLTVGTIRNNMNWEKGISIWDMGAGKKIVEKGAPVRTKAFSSQLGPKDIYSKVELVNRTLYDLIPGRIHAIDVNTLRDFGNYANKRELWTSLNPNWLNKFRNLDTLAKLRVFLDNDI